MAFCLHHDHSYKTRRNQSEGCVDAGTVFQSAAAVVAAAACNPSLGRLAVVRSRCVIFLHRMITCMGAPSLQVTTLSTVITSITSILLCFLLLSSFSCYLQFLLCVFLIIPHVYANLMYDGTIVSGPHCLHACTSGEL